jgi:hypothetical protein
MARAAIQFFIVSPQLNCTANSMPGIYKRERKEQLKKHENMEKCPLVLEKFPN